MSRPGVLVLVILSSCSSPPDRVRSERTNTADLAVAVTEDGGRSPPIDGVEADDEPRAPMDYTSLFAQLVDEIEKHHVFAEGPRARWASDKDRLRAEFARVESREDALVAVSHLQNALGDRHCTLSPPADLPFSHLDIGLSLFAEAAGDRTLVRVDEVLDPALVREGGSTVAEGDLIVGVDGQSVDAWLLAHPYESNSLNDDVRRAEQANAIASVTLPWSRVKTGDTRTLRFRRGEVEWDQTFTFADPDHWEGPSGLSLDYAPPMASIGCRADRHEPYPGFVLSAVGFNVCVYRGARGTTYATHDTRLVRFMSFLYDPEGTSDGLRAAKADHALLTRELDGAGAVILDVHENHGGNNPFVFLGWFAGKPWDHPQIHVRVSSDFPEDEVREFLYGDPRLIARYKQAAAEGSSEMSWPFLCQKNGEMVVSGSCEDQGPHLLERVTTAPVAIVTGPNCASSCDSLVASWSAFSMGPLVGRQPAHGFTAVRHTFPIADPAGRDLGRFCIALAWESFPDAGAPLEGAAIRLDWEAPRTFQTRRTWLGRSVQEADRLLQAIRER